MPASVPRVSKRRHYRSQLQERLVVLMCFCVLGGAGWFLGSPPEAVGNAAQTPTSFELQLKAAKGVSDSSQREVERRAIRNIELFTRGRIARAHDICMVSMLLNAGIIIDDKRGRVEHCALWGRGFEDRLLEQIARFTSLKSLRLPDGVSDSGLVHLKTLDRLTELHVQGTMVTDAGAEHLKNLSKLQVLGLKNTSVTADGLRRLKNALPNTAVKFVDRRDVEFRSPIKSKILYVSRQGDQVTKGDLLVQLDVSHLQLGRPELALAAETNEADRQKLKQLDGLISSCRIVAPRDGIVVYPTFRQSLSSTPIRIEQGEIVHERQKILILADSAFDGLRQ